MNRAAGSDRSSRGPLQPGCVVEEPWVSGSVCHCGGPLRTGLCCLRSGKSQTGSVTAGSFATEEQPNAIKKMKNSETGIVPVAAFPVTSRDSDSEQGVSFGKVPLSLFDEEEIGIWHLSVPGM
ncbi:hypothetical protein G5714_011689 [Onychostoma macrolepis]|uniref:Uncharacterized protein n=1 Tax=Onychostoma macrolepis TaxID=369639 RepID=A0A7J6CL82_9TELE|nr:hypothetical protein G5714_011689 [Onychostoma macrolepis]